MGKNGQMNLEFVVGGIMATEDIHVLIPIACKYVTLYSKGELRLQTELKLLISWH